MPQPVHVAIYARVSSDLQMQTEEGSLETQEATLRKAADLYNGAAAEVRVFREEGRSGKDLDRPALALLLQAIARGEISCVMVTRIDRLSRSLMDFLRLSDLFKEHGVEFRSLKESFDTSTAMGKAMLSLLLVFAQLEREQTGERVAAAMESRATRGLWNGGRPVLGYDSDSKGGLAVVEGEATVVQEAFDQFVLRQSTRKVARWLNEKGYRQKRFRSRRKGLTGGNEFTQSVVANMIRNRVYVGEVRNRGVWYSGRHVALVEQEVFDRANEILTANGEGAKRPTKAQPLPYLLAGLVKCGCCDNEDGSRKTLTSWTTRGRGGKRYRYYRCTSKGKKANPDCTVGSRSAGKVEDLVLAVVRKAVTEPSTVEEAVREAERMMREEITPARLRIEEMRGERDRLKRESDLLLNKLLETGTAHLGIAKSRLEEMDTRLRQLGMSIIQEEAELAVKETRHLDHEVLLAALRGFDGMYAAMTAAERKELLALLVAEVVVYPDDAVTVSLHDGDEVTTRLEGIKKRRGGGGGGGKGPAAPKAPVQKRAGPTGVTRLAQRLEWLPGGDRRQNLGGDLLGGAYAGEGGEDGGVCPANRLARGRRCSMRAPTRAGRRRHEDKGSGRRR